MWGPLCSVPPIGRMIVVTRPVSMNARSSGHVRSSRKTVSGAPARNWGVASNARSDTMAAKFFTGLPLDGPDPECVKGHGERALQTVGAAPRSDVDHSHRTSRKVPVTIGFGAPRRPDRACDTSPL